jgi:hypothetical protein
MSGQTRVWFYRPWEPSESLDLALIDMNGSYVGAVAKWQRILSRCSARALSHRPGELRPGLNQDRNVDLSPGQQLYVKIVSLDSWGMSVSGCKNCARDAFYAWLIPPEIAQAEIARDRTGI